ncbi:AAA family ATPase [Bradyrhizobium sp. 195]|uniref:AAA family ATPase n=1 Tax=Bradyrhizobium sp. 195 TaxID=2782662 RepID=UPI002000C625|nr:AAA family ATPase [Bradyrhizobium sp. 195]UPK26469.1 AAA family ATPase [Bradyrhizobium sp. 195]
MQPRLKTLVIENFRSLRGKVVIPLDAQVVLVHGTNGMGKTSVLSALELALTGRIKHLAEDGDGYQSYLTTLDTPGGSVQLTTTASYRDGARLGGSLDFSNTAFTPTPLLDAEDAKFFAERCYLPQATLGRLLELYDDNKTDTTSPLTQFVKELLGLDPLDALVDGLYPAFNVARVRNLVPEYRRLETLQTALRVEISGYERSIETVTRSSADRLAVLNATLSGLRSGDALVVSETSDVGVVRAALEVARDAERDLTELSGVRSDLRSVMERWRTLPSADLSHDLATKERAEQAAFAAVDAWRAGDGRDLMAIISTLQVIFSDIPGIDDGPEKSRAMAARRADAEASRCETLVRGNIEAAERVNNLNTTIQRSTTRIAELSQALASGVDDARSLASALAGVAPHIAGETCPVCERDFTEKDAGPLSAHIAAKIASLTSEAGRLQSLATERAEESNRLAVAQRDLLAAAGGRLSDEDNAQFPVRAVQMRGAAQRLDALRAVAVAGTALMVDAAAARETLALARRRDEISTSLLPDIEALVTGLTGRSPSSFDSIESAMADAERTLSSKVEAAQTAVSHRIRALSELDLYAKDVGQIADLKRQRDTAVQRFSIVEAAETQVSAGREHAKGVANTADKVRSAIVKKVFNTSLNKIWRDLFVRLAPSEQFVPAFKLPSGDGGKVEAVLETLHRSGKVSGSPGAMLSQGNLNTAALTLFLALHLSVPSRMPWLVLDDPVQSMDDVHIAQFAALLRTLAKGMGRQLIVAVHERALFDYLTLELSPAFDGDSLIAVEIARNFEGDAIAMPQAFGFEADRAIAA